jgi:prepilin-type N-terminal cleavage/methylation domain-containing protein/prepilin-type processing-associated H-X9-DG protein
MKTRRPGITLLETLVVISIIGILVSILIPAVQYVREISRRATCQNNLRQVVLGVQNHDSAHAALPSLYNGTFLAQPRTGIDEFHFHSWRSAILPELEQNPLHDALIFSLPATDAANQPAVNIKVPIFVCPSANNPTTMVRDLGDWNDGRPTLTDRTAARSDYEAVVGVLFHPSGTVDLQNIKFGAWGEPKAYAYPNPITYRKPRLGDIADGLSQTMLVAERAGRPDLYERGRPIDPYPFADPSRRGMDHHQAAWAVSTHFWWLVFWHDYSVNETNRAVFSFHASGANVGLADGSVRFLSESTDQETANALATRSSGDIVSLD